MPLVLRGIYHRIPPHTRVAKIQNEQCLALARESSQSHSVVESRLVQVTVEAASISTKANPKKTQKFCFGHFMYKLSNNQLSEWIIFITKPIV